MAEIDRKRKQLDKNEVTSKKKYFKRGELAAKQAEEYKKKEEERLRKKGLLAEKKKEEEDTSEYIRYEIIYSFYLPSFVHFIGIQEKLDFVVTLESECYA